MNSRRRVAMWANNCLMDENMVKTLKYGIYGKGNANTHSFRTVDKKKFSSHLPFVNRK
jgi:hypothetical protein